MPRSTPMSRSRARVRQNSTGSVHPTTESPKVTLMITGQAVLRNQSGCDESSKPASDKPSSIPTSTSSSQTKSRAKSLPPSPTHREADLQPPPTATTPQTESEKEEEVKVISTENKTEVERCPICLDDCTEPKQLDKCSHIFCTDCIDPYFHNVKPQCPCCFTIYGKIRGNQPESGEMKVAKIPQRLPGYGRTSKGTIQITYIFPDGVQDDKHPNPGVEYYGTSRHAFLPDNAEGQEILKLLERSFELRQTFTIGQSRTTGCDNVVTWNDIHHKTSIHGGMENFGYPDQTYLNRVRQELAAKGIK